MSTDNNEAAPWNGVLGGGNAAPCAEKPMTAKEIASGLTMVGLAAYGITAISRDMANLVGNKIHKR